MTNSADPTTTAREVTNVPIRSWDGTVLEADEYIPTTCTAAKPCPVILIQTPYRKGQSSTDPSDFGDVAGTGDAIPYLYEHGYIEVIVDVRGTGSSEGFWVGLVRHRGAERRRLPRRLGGEQQEHPRI